MIANLPASVRQRLESLARKEKRPFQEVLQYFGMERFLYRLAQSKHASKFTLKGALMFTAWRGSSSRPTKDIDLLAKMDNSVDPIVSAIRDVCSQAVAPDGLVFDPATVTGVAIKEDAEYSGVRVTFIAKLQRARISMQVDIGFGDIVTPPAALTDFPGLLDFDKPRLLAYPPETVVAEKFEAMTKLAILNSRMKDFYDLWILARQFNFDGATLAKAIRHTFANRKTPIESRPTALTETFFNDSAKQTQWQGFLRKIKVADSPPDLQTIVEALAIFLSPVANAAKVGGGFNQEWIAPGPWTEKK